MYAVIVDDINDLMYFTRHKTLQDAKTWIQSLPYNEDATYYIAEMVGEYVPTQTVVWDIIPVDEVN